MLNHQALLNETDFYFVVSKTYLKSYNKLRFWSVNLALRRIIHNYIISIYIFLISVVKDYDYIIRSNCTWLFLSRANRDKKSGPLRSHVDLKRKNKISISYVNWKWERLCLTFLENDTIYETPTLSLYCSLFQTIIIFTIKFQ